MPTLKNQMPAWMLFLITTLDCKVPFAFLMVFMSDILSVTLYLFGFGAIRWFMHPGV